MSIGERKTEVDLRASRPITKREEELRAFEDLEKLTYENGRSVDEGERKRILAQKGKGSSWRQTELAKLGPPPLPPLEPVLTCDEPAVEGLVKLLVSGQPTVGVFSGEGGVFIGGFGMNPDNRWPEIPASSGTARRSNGCAPATAQSSYPAGASRCT